MLPSKRFIRVRDIMCRIMSVERIGEFVNNYLSMKSNDDIERTQFLYKRVQKRFVHLCNFASFSGFSIFDYHFVDL